MAKRPLEHRTPSGASATRPPHRLATCLLGAFLLVMVGVSIWLYYQGVEKMDVVAEAIVIYIFGPAINAACGVALLGCALLLRARRGGSPAISACLVAAAAAPILAMLIDGIVISAAFH